MVSVLINGSEAGFKADSIGSIADIIEMIKASIDPEHMITSILINGQDMTESDWTARTAQYPTLSLTVETGTPDQFVKQRFALCWEVVRTVYNEFRDARKSFQAGDMNSGNTQLVAAVGTAKALFEWYSSILGLVKPENRARYDITEQVVAISETCKQLCQQQLYQSWWALGETIEKELEPRLDKLEDFCRKFATV